MIQHVWERCSEVRSAELVYVATDDERIASRVRGFGGEVVMTPPELASGTDRVAFAARSIEADIIINVQGDEPLMHPALIEAALAPVLLNETIEIGTAATTLLDETELSNPTNVKVVRSSSGRALYFSRAPIPFKRDAEISGADAPPYLKHIGLYIYRADALQRFALFPESVLERYEKLEQLRALENDMYVHVEQFEYNPIAVDVLDDVQTVLEAMKRAEATQAPVRH